jgi:L-2-hydroxycarboxylate dehydrogenase (NAD+)
VSLRHEGRWWTGRDDEEVASLAEVLACCVEPLVAAGVPRAKARFAAIACIEKDMADDHLRGVETLLGPLAELLAGRLAPDPAVEVVFDRGVSALLRAEPGFDYGPGFDAMSLCVGKASSHGVGVVGLQAPVRRLTPYLKLALDAGLVAFATTHSPPMLAPRPGLAPRVGNHPIGLAVAAGGRPPIVFDGALSQSSATPLIAAGRQARPVPEGVLLGPDGAATTDARAIADADATGEGWGSLVPIGGYKGYGLAVAIGVLTSVLLGDGCAAGTFFLCLAPAAFGDASTLTERVGEYLAALAPRPGEPRFWAYPGEASGEVLCAHYAAGTVPLTRGTLERLRAAGRRSLT